MRQSPLYQVVGQLGMWGTIINTIQAASLEHKGMREATWSGPVSEFRPVPSTDLRTKCVFAVGLLFAYTAAMFILYTTAPLLYRLASSVFYNLNLLSSDFFGLLFGK